MKLLVLSCVVMFAGAALAQVTPPPPTPAAMGGSPTDKARPAQKPVTPPTVENGPTAAAQRLSFAQQAFGLAHSAYRQGNVSADVPAMWSLRIYEAQKDVEPAAAKMHLERMVALEQLAKTRSQQGSAPMLDVMTTGFYRAQAEQLAGKK